MHANTTLIVSFSNISILNISTIRNGQRCPIFSTEKFIFKVTFTYVRKVTSVVKIESILAEFPKGDASTLISVLQAVQDAYGWLSERNIYAVSSYLNIPSSKIYGVATFYTQFRLKPLGRHIISICRGTACHVKGSERLIPVFEQELKIKAGETTKDGKFTLKAVACLGACSLAPVVAIDNDFYGNVQNSDVKRLLRRYD